MPQVKQRRCDPLREYLDEIPPKSAAAVGTALADDLFNTPVDKDDSGKAGKVDEVDEVDKQETSGKVGEVDEEPIPKVKDAVDKIDNAQTSSNGS